MGAFEKGHSVRVRDANIGKHVRHTCGSRWYGIILDWFYTRNQEHWFYVVCLVLDKNGQPMRRRIVHHTKALEPTEKEYSLPIGWELNPSDIEKVSIYQ